MNLGLTRLDVLAGLTATLSLGLGGTTAARAQAGPVIAAAASLQSVLPVVVEAFRARGGGPVRLVFGSSGALTTQIEQGAPFELFLSADRPYVARLAARGLTLDDGVLYAEGRIALFVPTGSRLKADGQLKDLAAALKDGRLRRLAIANPDHAPYGRAAREALTHAGLWRAIQPRLVVGENIAQAAQFASTGAAQGGLIAWSLAVAPDFARRGRSALIPGDWHRPLDQQMVLLRGAGPIARAFYGFLQGSAARSILDRYGFILPARGATG